MKPQFVSNVQNSCLETQRACWGCAVVCRGGVIVYATLTHMQAINRVNCHLGSRAGHVDASFFVQQNILCSESEQFVHTF